MSHPSMQHDFPDAFGHTSSSLDISIRHGLALIALLAVGLLPAQHCHAAIDKSAATPSKAKSPAPLHASGRVIALRKALAACEHKGNYFSREACKDKSRWKYCGAPFSRDQLWGKVPECPNSTPQNATP
jgi:hypothetical protein